MPTGCYLEEIIDKISSKNLTADAVIRVTPSGLAEAKIYGKGTLPGTYNHTKLIQEVIDYIHDNSGGRIFVGFGRYNLKSTLTIKSGVFLCGDFVGDGSYGGSPRTLFVNYFDNHVIEMQPGSGIKDIFLANGITSFSHSMIHITYCDPNRPIYIERVFGGSLNFSGGFFILLEVTGVGNIIGLRAFNINWNGFEVGIYLKSSSIYSNMVISGNYFIGFVGKYSKYFIKLERNNGGYQTGNHFIGIIQGGTGSYRGIYCEGDSNIFNVSIFDVYDENDVEVSGNGNIFIGWYHKIIDTGERNIVISPYTLGISIPYISDCNNLPDPSLTKGMTYVCYDTSTSSYKLKWSNGIEWKEITFS